MPGERSLEKVDEQKAERLEVVAAALRALEVSIITGKKTVLSYLLKPIGRAMQSAMTER